MNIPDLDLVEAYRKMVTIRMFEEKVAYFFSRALVHGTTHLCIGQEATAVGATSALQKGDLLFPTHRGHGHSIAWGVDLKKAMAELMGKETGLCKGRGGSMHFADKENGNMGGNGIVGGGIPLAVGVGLSLKMKKLPYIVLCFFGDGAINEGTFHESVNLASVWDLPIIFLCENNQYGMSMNVKQSSNLSDLSMRAHAYGIPGERVDGNDVSSVYESVYKARELILSQREPVLLVAETYRFTGHSKSDANRYRTREEIAEKKHSDPIQKLRAHLIEQTLADESQLASIEQAATQSIENAVEYAKNSPDPSADSIAENVYEELI